MNHVRVSRLIMVLAAAAVFAGCGSKDESAADTTVDGDDTLDPCKLLTDDQVRTVLPGLKSSMVTHSGGSLLQGVDAYQCAYMDEKFDGLNVILNVAVDDARFAEIKDSAAVPDDAQKVEVGDVGWVWVDGSKLKLSAHKGRTVVDLNLSGPGAHERSKELVELGKTVTANLG